MRRKKIVVSQVGITVITGDGFTDFACRDGLHAICVVTTVELPVS
jgi:hypothetical protein